MDINVIATCLNFAVVVAILYHYGRKPIVDFFQNRSDILAKAVKEAEAVSLAAAKAKSDSAERLKLAEEEMKTRRRELTGQLKTQKEQTLLKASQEAERIHRDTQQLSVGEQARTQDRLIREISEECVTTVKKHLTSSLESKDKEQLLADCLKLISNGNVSQSV